MNQFFLGSSPRITALVWGLAGAIFSLFSVRLVATSAFMHGLPHHGTWIAFWLFIAFFFLLPIARPSRGILFYLGSLPVLSSLDLLQIGPCWKVHEVALAAFFLGWYVWFVFRGRKVAICPKWIDFAIGCLTLSFALGSIYGLAHPSWVNSMSVAFSWAHWPEKTEFNAISMGYAYMAGTFVYAALRFALEGRREDAPRILLRILGIQLTLSVFLAFGYSVVRAFLDGGMSLGRDFLLLPFGPIHSLAGPALLLTGFFIGVAVYSLKHNQNKFITLYAGAAFAAMFLTALSISKSAWLGLIALAASAFGALFGRRAFIAAAFGCICIFIIVRIFVPDAVGHPGAHGWIKDQLVVFTSPMHLGKQKIVTERIGIWMNAAKMIASHPIAGVGIGQYISLMEHYPWRGFIGTKRWESYSNPKPGGLNALFAEESANAYHAHNDFLEIATGMGLPVSLLFLAVFLSLLRLAWIGRLFSWNEGGAVANGVFFAFVGFAFMTLVDSRMTSFVDSILVWQLAAGVAAIAYPQEPLLLSKSINWLRIFPVIATVLLFLGAAKTIAGKCLPSNRSFGIWNWRLLENERVYLLAKQAQFIIPNMDKTQLLKFEIPKDAGYDSTHLKVTINNIIIFNDIIKKHNPIQLDIESFRNGVDWSVVRSEASRWVGTGAFGSPFGVKPYSISLTKLQKSNFNN